MRDHYGLAQRTSDDGTLSFDFRYPLKTVQGNPQDRPSPRARAFIRVEEKEADAMSACVTGNENLHVRIVYYALSPGAP